MTCGGRVVAVRWRETEEQAACHPRCAVNSADLCIERVKARVHSGGHFVEGDIVRRRYERSLKNFFGPYQSLADDWRVYDNSGVAGSRIVAEGHETVPTVVHEPETWDEMRRRARA